LTTRCRSSALWASWWTNFCSITHPSRFSGSLLGNKKVSKLKPAQIDALLSEKLDSGLSVSTVRRIRSVLAQALTQAQRWEMVGRKRRLVESSPKGAAE
jgi:hypothetical protein